MRIDASDETVLKLQLRLAQLERNERCQENFLDFVKAMWPEFIAGRHHHIIAEKLERVARGELKRLIINMAPRHTKSEFASYLFPAWMMGRNSKMKIIQATHTTELAVNFGRKTKNLLDSDEYKEVFPQVKLSADSKASGRWDTAAGGMYYAVGVGSNLAGRGADLCVALDSVVETPRGPKKASEVVVGDELLGLGGYNPVRHVIRSEHSATVTLNGELEMSDHHPVLTEGGWKDACDLAVGDVVYRISSATIDESTIAKEGFVYDSVLQTRVQHLGHDAPAVQQPERGKLRQLRRSGHCCLRKVVEVFQFLGRHGRRALEIAYSGPLGQRRPLFAGELRLVVGGGSAEQPPQYRLHYGLRREAVPGSMVAAHGPDAGSDQAPHFFHGDGARGSFGGSPDVSQPAARGAVGFFRRCRSALRVFGRYGKEGRLQPAGGAACFGGEGKDFRWIPVAVRSVERTEHGPRSFVNFHVENSNTFIANSYLTHNCIIDDPHSEQTAMSANGFEYAYDWYTGGPRQRLQPGGAIVLVQTRWSEKDLTGQLLRAQAKDPLADQWEVVELPAIFDDGTPCWPEFWSIEDLTAVRASIPPSKWNAQYQQNPTGEENAIIKREWWKRWEKESIPQLQYVIQSYDTAFSKRETSDYSAITTWGVFYPQEGGPPNLILLDSKKGRWDFPELKAIAFEEYKYWEPDTVIVEAKASGMPLTHELRQVGIPVVNFTPSRGNDKVSRVHAISPLLEAGMVWAPDTTFADELIEEVAAFPNGEHDDLVDSMTQALMRYRQGNFVQLPTDDWEDEDSSVRIPVYY